MGLSEGRKVQRFSTMKSAFTAGTAAPVGRRATSEFRFDDIAGCEPFWLQPASLRI
jgi:hypothetical protein